MISQSYSFTYIFFQILNEKKGEPNKYASYWEKDENDIDEPSEEEIQSLFDCLSILYLTYNGMV